MPIITRRVQSQNSAGNETLDIVGTTELTWELSQPSTGKMEQTIATKRRRNIGKSVTAKTRACLRPDVPRRQREDTIMIPVLGGPFILPLALPPSTQPLFPFFPIAFPTFPLENGRTDAERAEKAKAEMAGGENRNYRPRGGRKQWPSRGAARWAWSRNRLKKVTPMMYL